ncbi:AMP-binding enzyme [Streptomyces sp. TLI_185]|nr:AMP-binding enzyme [Streptomyces sp. TLI_185]
MSGPGEAIVRPPHVKFLDYEVELGLVIGAPLPVGTVVEERDLPAYVAGLVLSNDVSARDIQLTRTQFYESKSYPTFDETGSEREVTGDALRAQVASVAATLRELGVGTGDRVVGCLPNTPHAVAAFLAAASLGAVWSVCGQDYAPQAAADRFAQLEPTVLVAADGYRFNGTTHDRRPRPIRRYCRGGAGSTQRRRPLRAGSGRWTPRGR